jgi:TolB-like protein
MSLFSELKRRNVFRVGIAYLITGWLVMQVADVVLNNIAAPEWVFQVIMLVVAIGLPLVLVFAWAFELTPEGLKREKDVNRGQSITNLTGRKLDRAIIVVLVAAVAYFIWESRFADQGSQAVSEEAALQSADPAEMLQASAAPSIAVLPFVNMSEDAGNEYFSDGIAEEILNALAKVRQLKVAGRTSSFAFKGQNDDLRRIGEALGVNHILEGSVRKAGNQVRITAQLVQVQDGFHLWSETYDRELVNVFAIQDEIAGAILDQLKLRLLEGEASGLTAATTDTQAYERYLLAKQRIYDRNKLSLEAAGELLDSVIEIDPYYAPALAQRGIVYLLLREGQYGDIPLEEALELAKELLDRALALDPELAEAWAGIGLYHTDRPGGHFEAIEALEKALSINPNLINASNWLQIAYSDAGQTGKVLPIVEGMLERDPLYRPAIGNAINEFNRLGMQERSLALIERVRPFIPDDAHLVNYQANTLLSQGRFAEALPLSTEALRRQPSDDIFRLSVGFALWNTHQYEKLVAPEFPDFFRIFALDVLDRKEEATILAYERAAEGYPGPLLWLLNRAGRPAEVVRYVEERWADLDAYEAAFPRGGTGHGSMMDLAYAYARTGDDLKFQDAMQRIRKAHDQLAEEGVQHWLFAYREALYYALSRDTDRAIERLEQAADRGMLGLTLRLAVSAPILEPLEGDPRFEAVQARMTESLNAQRAALGLEPATL